MGSLDKLSNYQQSSWVETESNMTTALMDGGTCDKCLIAVWERLMHVAVYSHFNFKNTIFRANRTHSHTVEKS